MQRRSQNAMKLAVTTICPHVRDDAGRWTAYEPFVLEMNVWAELFDQLVMVAPLDSGGARAGTPPPFSAPYAAPERIRVVPYRRDRRRGAEQLPTALWELPRMAAALVRACRDADALHVRCPGSIGLLGALGGRFLARRRVAKYAGQWTPYEGEPRSFRLQRRLLASRWWGAPVTVYGDWPDAPAQVVPFFTAVVDESEMARARAVAAARAPRVPATVLFAGRLTRAKNVDVLLAALAHLRREGIEARALIVGDGPERAALEARARDLGLDADFAGGVAHARMADFYARGDVLVLASETEGWPKALTEAMAYGLICVGSDRGLVPQLLADGRGVVVPPGDVEALAAALAPLLRAPGAHREMARAAAGWAQRFTLERLRDALRQLLAERWQLPAAALDAVAAPP